MFANADVYAPDDAARDANDQMIRTNQGVMQVQEEHPGTAALGNYSNPWVALGALGLIAFLWHRFHRG